MSSQVEKWFKLAEAAEEDGNHSAAYRYFTDILEEDPENSKAWLGKAFAAGWDAGLNGNRFQELENGISRALSFAAKEDEPELRKRAAQEIQSITAAYFQLSIAHTMEFIALDNTWNEHLERCVPILDALTLANKFDPKNSEVLETGVKIAKAMIEGVQYHDEYAPDVNGFKQYKTAYLSPKLETLTTEFLNGFVSKLQAEDPTFEVPKIQKAGKVTLSGCLMLLGIIVVVGAIGLWIVVYVARQIHLIPE